MENQEVQKPKETKRKNLIWTMVLSILSGIIFGLSFLLYSSYSTANYYASSLETTYQKSYYDLVDKVNNMEVKLSKAISSTDTNYSAKILSEISKNAEDAQNNLNVLPVSINGVEESLTFINQVGGYTGTLAKHLQKGEALSENDSQTLEQLHASILKMKRSLTNMSENIWQGYSILDKSMSLEGDYNDFTVNLQSIKASDVEYPTMIYDGPFSDSQLKKEVRGLTGGDVSEQDAANRVAELFEVEPNSIVFEGEAKANFETYDFSFDKKNISFYAQLTKKGGKLLTLASYNDKNLKSYTKEQAEVIAKDFVAKEDLQQAEVVWSDVVGKDAYFNFAPKQNGVIIYPDLIKVKVDLATGLVVGYEAKSYYTNNTQRNLKEFSANESSAQAQVKSGYSISTVKKVLAPIDFEEILCWEFKTVNNGSIFYFYVDSQTGQLVNILKVIYTTDGSKLM